METKAKQNGSRPVWIIGIDPGKSGAMVALRNGEVKHQFEIPTIGKELDYDAVFNILQRFRKLKPIVYIEHVHAMVGKWGATGNFGLGLSYGALRMAIVGCGYRYFTLTPKSWQKISWRGVTLVKKKSSTGKTMVTDTKKTSLLAAKRIFPKETWIPKGKRTPQDGLYDAALIAYAGYKMETTNE